MEKLDELFDIVWKDKKYMDNGWKQRSFRTCSKDCDFHNDQKTTRDSKCTAVTEKLTPSEVKFKQKFCILMPLQSAKDPDWTQT